MDLSPTTIGLLLTSFAAAVLNGAVGYGFSSVVTPIALFWVTNRLLNPSLVLVELGVNVVMLVRERKFLRATYRRALPVIAGLIPGVLVGSVALLLIAPIGVRVFVYSVLLPLTLLQLMGFQRRIVRERALAGGVGAGIGFLYSLTTISGPPLALFWRNQGLAKSEFRCMMSQIRVAEASFTTVSYLALGLFTPASVSLVPVLLFPVLVGVPLGTLLLQSLSRDFFSRLVMAVDGLIVSYGLYRVVVPVGWLTSQEGLLLLLLCVLAIGLLAFRALARLPTIWATAEERRRERIHGFTDEPAPIGGGSGP